MKTISTALFLILSLVIKSQTSDVLYIPNQNSIVISLNPNNLVGLYGGGYMITSFPQPYTYTTPFTIFNRVGLSIGNDKISIMGGIYSENSYYLLDFKPDFWIKINPIRFLTNKRTRFDLSLGLNYSDKINPAFGISIRY